MKENVLELTSYEKQIYGKMKMDTDLYAIKILKAYSGCWSW